jgi:hypothetical protein
MKPDVKLKLYLIKQMMKKRILSLLPLIIFAAIISCDKEPEIPPTLELKVGLQYTSQDATIDRDSTLTVGIIATKTEDNLKSYNVSVAYDGATTTQSLQDFTIPSAENSLYEKDVTFTVRDQAGVEKYFFTITDVDGNIVQKILTFTVE